MKKANLKGENSIFAIRLKELMENNITQQQLADVLNIKRQTVSLYLNGASLPPIEKLVDIANYFNVSTDYLLGLAKSPTVNPDIKMIENYTGLSRKVIDLMHDLFAENKSKSNTYLEGFNLFFGLSMDSMIFFDRFYRVMESSVIEEKKFKAFSNSTPDNSDLNDTYKNLEKAWNEESKNLAFEKFSLYETINNAIEISKAWILKNKINLFGDCNADD